MNEENKYIESNEKNKEEYEKIVEDVSPNLEDYYDKKNPFVKILLLVLGLLIIIGVAYYFIQYFS